MFAATDVRPQPISFAYRAGLFGVVLGLLALPSIYFGLVAAIAFGVWFHVRTLIRTLLHSMLPVAAEWRTY